MRPPACHSPSPGANRALKIAWWRTRKPASGGSLVTRSGLTPTVTRTARPSRRWACWVPSPPKKRGAGRRSASTVAPYQRGRSVQPPARYGSASDRSKGCPATLSRSARARPAPSGAGGIRKRTKRTVGVLSLPRGVATPGSKNRWPSQPRDWFQAQPPQATRSPSQSSAAPTAARWRESGTASRRASAPHATRAPAPFHQSAPRTVVRGTGGAAPASGPGLWHPHRGAAAGAPAGQTPEPTTSPPTGKESRRARGPAPAARNWLVAF